MKAPRQPLARAILVAVLAGSLGACATLSSDGGEGEVRAQASRLMGQETRPQAMSAETRAQRRDELLAQPLRVEDAVTLALINNPGLQRAFAELRLTEAEVVPLAAQDHAQLIWQFTQVGEFDVTAFQRDRYGRWQPGPTGKIIVRSAESLGAVITPQRSL